MVSRLDNDVGKINQLIKDLGLEENTIVIFTSDNGPLKYVPAAYDFFDSNGPFRGGKRDLYEGGIRVPLVVKWKDQIESETTTDTPVVFWDFLPTFADILDFPGKTSSDGSSFWPVLKGNTKQEPDYFYWDYGHVRDTFLQAARTGHHKLIMKHSKDKVDYELYNLADDPQENINIAGQYPGMVNQLKEYIQEAYEYSENYPRKVSK